MPTVPRFARGAAFALSLAMTGTLHAAAAPDMELRLAKEAAARGDPRPAELLRARYAGHLLEPYPHYWTLVARIDRADPVSVRAFLDKYPDTPLADALRREWLRHLGGAGAWEAFRAVHLHYAGADPEVACLSFQERLQRGDAVVLDEARRLFTFGTEVPPSCDPVFAAAFSAGKAQSGDAWARMRKLLAAGYVKDAVRTNALLGSRGLNENALAAAHANPSRFLAAAKVLPPGEANSELLLFAIARLARGKPEEAHEKLLAVLPALKPEVAREAWGHVAWHGAAAHDPRALEWFGRAEGAALDDTQVAWKARAGLRAGDWNAVLAAIQALTPGEARDPTWRYWRARALKALGSPEAATALLRTVAQEPGFYGLLAADDLGLTRAPDWNGWQPATADFDRVRAIGAVARALALYRLDLDQDAFREWVWGLRQQDDRTLLTAAELARQASEPDRAINTADRTVETHDFAQRYPVPHREALATAAKRWGVDEAWMYGIIRQESRFVTEARSRVGATGLMQLMPATARWVAGQMSLPGYHASWLTRPEVNVHMGAYYFRRVLGDLNDPVLATAAYNAGPGRARRWRDARALEGAIYAETIPFNETRDYVKKVVANAWYYSHRLTGKSPGLRQLLGQVPARPPGAALAAAIP